MILPLPVKKNKFGQRVADINAEKYYRQIFEEVLEAHHAAVTSSCLLNNDYSIEEVDRWDNDEAEELVDAITCCVTRLAIIGYGHWVDKEIIETLNSNFEKKFADTADDFYKHYLISEILESYQYAVMGSPVSEAVSLANVISCCIKYLEYLGYDESARQKIYAEVNDKNRKRGYFDS